MSLDALIIEAPSFLGLHPSGVSKMPQVFRELGFHRALTNAAPVVLPPPHYSSVRSSITGLLNEDSIASYARTLAHEVGSCLDAGRLAIVLGGDCSVVLGPLLALKERGESGLIYFDGHTSFHSSHSSGSGEVADMDLALACGRGEGILNALSERGALVLENNVILIGDRDLSAALEEGSPDIRESQIVRFPAELLETHHGKTAAMSRIAELAKRDDLHGFWIHLDVDVVNDSEMSAVDYRIHSGISLNNLEDILKCCRRTGAMSGISITIYNPELDPGFVQGNNLVAMLIEVLSS